MYKSLKLHTFTCERLHPQIREQMSGPDPHVFALKFLALKKWVFPHKKILSKIFLTFVYLYSMQIFSADPKIFSKKNKLFSCP